MTKIYLGARTDYFSNEKEIMDYIYSNDELIFNLKENNEIISPIKIVEEFNKNLK